MSPVPTAGAFSKGEVTGVNGIIPDVLRAFLLTCASKDAGRGLVNTQGDKSHVPEEITLSLQTSS